MSDTLREDRKLLNSCLEGDREALEQFVRRFSDLVYRYIQQTLLVKNIDFNTQDLEDFHNHVFLQLLDKDKKKLRQFQGKNGCSLTSWIRMVTVRLVLSSLRKRGIDAIGGRRFLDSLDLQPDLPANRLESWQTLEKMEQERQLASCLENLPARDRLLLKLHYSRGLSLSATADLLGLSRQNAYSVKHRAIRKLKDLIVTASEI